MPHSNLAFIDAQQPALPFVERRTGRRRRVILAGRVAFGMVTAVCTIFDLSEGGARIHAPSLIDLPEEVLLLVMREGLLTRAKRIWARPPAFGLTFTQVQDIETSGEPESDALRGIWREWISSQDA